MTHPLQRPPFLSIMLVHFVYRDHSCLTVSHVFDAFCIILCISMAIHPSSFIVYISSFEEHGNIVQCVLFGPVAVVIRVA